MRLRPHHTLTAVGLMVFGSATAEQETWHVNNLEEIGGHQLTVEGDPKLIDTPFGKAVEFDGVDDGIFLDVHPLDGMTIPRKTILLFYVLNPFWKYQKF